MENTVEFAEMAGAMYRGAAVLALGLEWLHAERFVSVDAAPRARGTKRKSCGSHRRDAEFPPR